LPRCLHHSTPWASASTRSSCTAHQFIESLWYFVALDGPTEAKLCHCAQGRELKAGKDEDA
jgi:hypothetical protein